VRKLRQANATLVSIASTLFQALPISAQPIQSLQLKLSQMTIFPLTPRLVDLAQWVAIVRLVHSNLRRVLVVSTICVTPRSLTLDLRLFSIAQFARQVHTAQALSLQPQAKAHPQAIAKLVSSALPSPL